MKMGIPLRALTRDFDLGTVLPLLGLYWGTMIRTVAVAAAVGAFQMKVAFGSLAAEIGKYLEMVYALVVCLSEPN